MRRLLPWFLVLAACTRLPTDSPEDAQETASEFEERLAADLSELAAASLDVAAGADGLAARDTDEACYDTVGDCRVCYALDGNPLAGTFSAGLEEPGCGDEVANGSASSTYTVAQSVLEGSWAATGPRWAIEATGSRDAELVIDTSRRDGGRSYDSSWSLTELSATVTTSAVEAMSAAMTYTGFGGRAWQIDLAWDGTEWTGTIANEAGDSCTVSGTAEAPSVACDPA